MLFVLFAQAAVAVVASGGSAGAAAATTRYPSCPTTHPSCPTFADGGRAVNNSNFHLRDVAITAGPDGWYYLTGTSNSAGDHFWTDVWGVVCVWRSRTPLVAGSFVGGGLVFNLTRDCKFCGPATAAGGCRAFNSCAQCGVYRNDSADGGCTPKTDDCGGRVWAPELHYLPGKAADLPGSGGWFISFHFHCAGGESGVLQSTSGTPFGPFTDLVHGVPGGDVTLFQDPKDGEVYTVSSGGALVASRLSRNMSAIVKQTKLSPECGAQNCEDSAIGFEGPYVLLVNGTYYLSSSAFGNASQHGGPRSAFAKKGAPTDSHYSSYMGSAHTFLGPYTNGEQRKPGSWLALDSGGHNNYFEHDGEIYGTVWYGSEPNGDVPPAYKGLTNLPSVAKMGLVNGRLVQASSASSLKSDDHSAEAMMDPPPPNAGLRHSPLGILNATASCPGVDGSGDVDVTQALQACITKAYVANQALFLAPGRYLVSDSLTANQADGGAVTPFSPAPAPVNIVPGRFRSNVLLGSTAGTLFIENHNN